MLNDVAVAGSSALESYPCSRPFNPKALPDPAA